MRVLLVDINPFMPRVTPISLGNLGAVLKEQGHEVRILSLGSESRFSPPGLFSFLRDFGPRLVGFGTYQRNILHVRAMARMVRQALPGARVLLGGPQATYLPDRGVSAMPEVDFVSRGEGELSIRAVAEAIEGGVADRPVAGVTTRNRDGACFTGPSIDRPADLDRYPSPWLGGVLDPADTRESIMLTSRGCTFNCAFCYTPAASGRRIRAHSVERTLEEIAYVCRKGTGRLWFADPNFSFDQKRVVRILEGILGRGLEPSMWIETRADMVTPDLLSLMKRAGVHTIALGLESVAPAVYPALDKKMDPEQIGRAAREAMRAGMEVELFSQYALPGERLEDAMLTLKFVKQCGIKIQGNSNAQQMQLYFGSEICTNHGKYGVRPLRERLAPYLSLGTEYETEWMSAHEIQRIKTAWRAESLDGGKRVVS
jgi:anaerobic magnesium-protoporphyrin IX monomethyl ester cyclase